MSTQNIISLINKVAKVNNLRIQVSEADLDKGLRELGLDSLTVVSIVVGVENELKIRIADEALGQIKTLRELIYELEHANA
ncbi:acyl carrier protein [Candidatus Malacoplasma girerdii]|uniref:Acyl carrier protein n=1 Tax=Candidatus Malacoplasma girerdii TaxID=1318617 RepID=A0A097SSH1_9BACT|nr:acyl carrier protein [Candidatus Malacoplasma girerdii]ASJ89089.1 MAG: acyl carrier protein [Candidatus Malacoplasma girerdii]